MSLEHEGFSCMESGLWLNSKWPYMGASPDGTVTCDCHGAGICEIKVIRKFIKKRAKKMFDM